MALVFDNSRYDDIDSYESSELTELDGFISDDGKHHVVWKMAEIAQHMEYETWWCETHDRLYYGGCSK